MVQTLGRKLTLKLQSWFTKKSDSFNSSESLVPELKLTVQAKTKPDFDTTLKRSKPNPFSSGYENSGIIGYGANGRVYKAKPYGTNDTVAIKVFHPYLDYSDISREQEMHGLMGTIYTETHSGFIVMKYFQGRTLEQELLDPESIYNPLEIYREAKQALLKLYSLGYYHGDSNTGNFMVTDESVYLIDYCTSRRCTMLDSILKDIKKLAANVYDELQLRDSVFAEACKEEARLDFLDPERILE
ncbi:hypothetical protein HDV01_003226 [Terramyces sp. JEL0728]|nr:hypothetical protein HDV01_003226 [Terramyces sp. JEL0728]